LVADLLGRRSAPPAPANCITRGLTQCSEAWQIPTNRCKASPTERALRRRITPRFQLCGSSLPKRATASNRPTPVNFTTIHPDLLDLTRLQMQVAITRFEMLAVSWTAPPTAKGRANVREWTGNVDHTCDGAARCDLGSPRAM